SDTSRIVDRLIKKKLVSKKTCKMDKRLVDICITRQGLDILERLDNNTTQVEMYMSSLTEEEAEQLSKLLDKVRAK
ncbi:MAG: MarR family winged helix-turn-helix transcriptional regulator, partial [Owenweeksia sp.]